MAPAKDMLTKSMIAISILFSGTSALAARPELTDAEIAHVQITLNNGEIKVSQAALSETHDARVRRFARTMIAHHRQNNQQVLNVSRVLRMAPMDNIVSQRLERQNDEQMDRLRRERGAQFDIAYVLQQIQAHRQALMVIDERLIPNASAREVKNLLQRTRPVVIQHLKEAYALRGQLQSQNEDTMEPIPETVQ